MQEDKHKDEAGQPVPEGSNGKAAPISESQPEKKSKPRKRSAQRELEKLRDEIAQWKEKYLRLAAEFDNYKKRKERESEEVWKIANANLLKNILPIADDLERSVASAKNHGDFEALVAGLELVHSALLKVFEAEGVKQIQAVGEAFNPEIHEALLQVEKAGVPPHTVVEEHEKGYMLGDRILRPAKVLVSK